MASTEWTNEQIDRIFDAVTEAVMGDGSVAEVVREINAANTASLWPDIVLEDILDADVIGESGK